MKPRLICGLALSVLTLIGSGCAGSGQSAGQAPLVSPGAAIDGTVQQGVDVNTFSGASSEASSIPISIAFVGTTPANFSGAQGLGSDGQFYNGATSQQRQADRIVDLSFRFINNGSKVLSGYTPAQIFVDTSLNRPGFDGDSFVWFSHAALA